MSTKAIKWFGIAVSFAEIAIVIGFMVAASL